MPSGARKRKASKKKGKNGEAHNNSSSTSSSSNSSSTHSQGSEDPRSLDDRESDSGEVEREEEEKEEAIGEVKVVDYGKGLSDEIAEITKEAKNEKIVTLGLDFGGVDVAKETPISVPRNGGLQDKEVAVEEVKAMVAVSKSKALAVSSVLETKPRDEAPNPDAIAVELVKNVVALPQETNVGRVDLVEFKLIKNADLALQNSDVKEKFPSTSKDLQSEKSESKIVSKDEDKSVVAPPVDFKALETGKQLEEQLVAPAVTGTTQVAESVKNKENLEQSDNQAGLTVVSTTSEVDNGEEVETQTRSIDQTLIGSSPLLVRRTSWMGCCGLFELFSGANR